MGYEFVLFLNSIKNGLWYRDKMGVIKKLACCFVMFVGITASYTGYNMYSDYTAQEYWTQDSYVSSMGLPIDEYGFLEL